MRDQTTRIALALVLLLLGRGEAAAQQSLSTTACPGLGCATYQVGGNGSMGVQVSGTFSGTLQFEQTIDGATWFTWAVTPNGLSTTVTSATATGLWVGNTFGVVRTRVRFSAYTSGTAVVMTAISLARATPGGGGGTPGGSDTQVQYNCAGVFCGDPGLTFNPVTDTIISGRFRSSAGASGDVAYSLTPDQLTGMYLAGGGNIVFSSGGNSLFGIVPDSTTIRLAANYPLVWTNSVNNVAGASVADLFLRRDAANVLAQSNGTIAQKHCWAQTFTDASNREYGCLDMTVADTVTLSAETAGTGADNISISLVPAGTGNVLTPASFVSNTNNVAALQGRRVGGALADLFRLDNGDNNLIGSSTGSIVFNNGNGGVFTMLGADLHVNTPSADIKWSGRALIRTPADGVFQTTNNAANGFTRMVFGTNDTSGISIVKSGTETHFRLGDGTGRSPTSYGAYQAAPSSPENGQAWVECVGTSPSRVCATKVQDGGATRTIASITY